MHGGNFCAVIPPPPFRSKAHWRCQSKVGGEVATLGNRYQRGQTLAAFSSSSARMKSFQNKKKRERAHWTGGKETSFEALGGMDVIYSRQKIFFFREDVACPPFLLKNTSCSSFSISNKRGKSQERVESSRQEREKVIHISFFHNERRCVIRTLTKRSSMVGEKRPFIWQGGKIIKTFSSGRRQFHLAKTPKKYLASS